MIEIVRAVPAALFAVAAIAWALVALDLGRRWIVVRDRTRATNERMDAVEESVKDRLDTFDKAIVIKAKAIQELESRLATLEVQMQTNDLARGLGRRRMPHPMGE